MRRVGGAAALWVTLAGQAQAHATEQGFILLLPTKLYILSGGLVVTLTVLMLALLPGRAALAPFRPVTLWRRARPAVWPGLAVAALLFWLVWQGWSGSRDPLGNPVSLAVWVVFWMGFVSLQGLWGDIWSRLDPWRALARLGLRRRPPLRYPRGWGHWPAVLGFLAVAGFLLADPAPADPARLAVVVAGYAIVTLAALVLFGPRWLVRGEVLGVFLRAYAGMGVFGRRGRRRALGLPGWQVLRGPRPSLALAVLMLLLLGSGSFDGLNETFWWLALIGTNPLEFPGRSAVVAVNVAGLLIANAALLVIFAGALALGARLAHDATPARDLIRLYAPTLLPIALAYHIAHYLPSLLLDGQYVLAGLAEALHLGHIHVSAGFLSHPGPVRLIWLTQAGVVVAGHVIALMLAHAIALHTGQSVRRAALGQAPLAAFMVAYTVFGLWLLAAPRGA
ncbi:hypothetical protein ACSSV8_001897 [Roseovarius sp. MBR-79]|jgi:hypothetical protein